jgi:hypothetical protein
MEQRPVERARFLCVCFEHGVRSMLELGTGEHCGVARFCADILPWDVTSIDIAPGREGCEGVTTFWTEIAYLATGDTRPTRGLLKHHHYEIVDSEHPVGIGLHTVHGAQVAS